MEAGTLGEAPCPAGPERGGEFAAWKQGGDIVAGFFGHDHVNDFIIPYEGIDLINTNSTGFTSTAQARTTARGFSVTLSMNLTSRPMRDAHALL